jgi:hypothetical protein
LKFSALMRPYRIPALLFAAFLPLYLPFRSRFLVNWDAVNFALGTLEFDLQHHQPHPPGYIGYIAAGWLLNHVTGDANTSLTLLSVVSVAAAPAGFFLLASLFMERRHALWSAVLLGLSPLVWYYSGVALTYAVELTLGLFYLWTGYLGRQRRSPGLLLAATLLLVMLGAMRPSGALFLMPLWLYLVWPLSWRGRISMASVLVLGSLVWLVPLMWLSGGVGAFVRASRELVDLVVMPTSVFGAGDVTASGPVGNLIFLGLGVLVGVNLGLVPIGLGLIGNPRRFTRLRKHWVFLALWLAPSVATYVLVHTGQLGYALLILPAFYLFAGVALEGLAEVGRRRPVAAWGLPLLLATANVVLFLAIPAVMWGFVPKSGATPQEARGGASSPVRWAASGLETGGVGSYPRQFDIRRSDRYWSELVSFAEGYDPETTVILAAADPGGSFRHLTYYLPGHRVYGLGWDLQHEFGHLFTAHRGTSDYSPKRLVASDAALTLPGGVDTVVIADGSIQSLLTNMGGTSVLLDSGFAVVVVPVAQRATVVMRDTPTDDSVGDPTDTAPEDVGTMSAAGLH